MLRNFFQVEKAAEKDLKEIQELNLLLFKKEWKEFKDKTLNLKWTFSETGTNYFKRHLAEKDWCAFKAVQGSKIIGYLAGKILQNRKSFRTIKTQAELSSLFVLEEFRNQGIGAMLFKEFEKWCVQNNAESIKVESSVKNLQGISFYKKNGFSEYWVCLEKSIKGK